MWRYTAPFFFGSFLCVSFSFLFVQCAETQSCAANPPQIFDESTLLIELNEWENVTLNYVLNDDDERNATISIIDKGKDIFLHYVRNFLTSSEAETLINICDKRDGWSRSRVVTEHTDEDKVAQKQGLRTSSSCPLIWPLFYINKLDEVKKRGAIDLEFEINFTWLLTQRIASFLEVSPAQVEPLQIVRYEHGEFYKKHHDHGKYYGESMDRLYMKSPKL